MILVDGVLHEGTVAPFDLSDRGLTLGDGLFETMAAFGGRVFRPGDHLDRLERGLARLGFSVSREKLEADVATVVAEAPAAGAVIRLTVTRGGGARGLAMPATPRPTVIVALAPFDPKLVFEPTTLATSSIRRNEHSPVSRLKAIAYLDNILAVTEAKAAGAKDALILNTAGDVACTSVANVFRIANGRLETPPASDGLLPGITRALVLEAADKLGLVAEERSLEPADLLTAEAVFLTNSVRLVQPVTSVDGFPLVPDHGMARWVLDTLLARIEAECGSAPLTQL